MINEKIGKINPFILYCQKIIPLAFDESMSYYECLCALVNHINELDKVVNINSEGLKQLKEYVDNYFNSLDVQEEINNKLDAMAESGQLTDIIAQYLQLAGMLCYDTINDLKTSTNMVNGSYVKTLGYHTINDGGSSIYKVRNITNKDNVNEMNLIALNNSSLVAELIVSDNTINVKQFGAYGDSTHDDSNAFNYGIEFLNSNGGGTLYIPDGDYKISSTITGKENVNVIGQNMRKTHLINDGLNYLFNYKNANLNGLIIKNLNCTSNNKYGVCFGFGSTLTAYNSAILTIENILIQNFNTGIYGGLVPAGVGLFDSILNNIWINNCSIGINCYSSGNSIIKPRITNCDTGISLGYLNGESYDGGVVSGGIFILNKYDISISSANGIRPISFNDCWFEQSEYGIINVAYANTKVMNLTFKNCMFNTNTTVYDLLNFYNVLGNVNLEDNTIIQTVNDSKINIIKPSDANSKIYNKNTFIIKYDGTTTRYVDKINGQISKVGDNSNWIIITHNQGKFAKEVVITPLNADARSLGNFYVDLTYNEVIVYFTNSWDSSKTPKIEYTAKFD